MYGGFALLDHSLLLKMISFCLMQHTPFWKSKIRIKINRIDINRYLFSMTLISTISDINR